ncbi:neurexin protein binding [Homalodisca vitripennis]|nr:neurexin protein binding [Homalodisca vitripennis]
MEVPASTGPLLVDDTVHRVRGHEFRLRPVSDSQVEECVRGMRGGSAPGMDGLPVALLKQQINDTAILFERRSWEEVYRVAAGELVLVKRWFDENILTMNVSKTKCMPISLRSAGEPPVDMGLVLHSCGDTNSGSCDCRVLQRVNQYKYLGVIMDSKLKWEPHIHIPGPRSPPSYISLPHGFRTSTDSVFAMYHLEMERQVINCRISERNRSFDRLYVIGKPRLILQTRCSTPNAATKIGFAVTPENIVRAMYQPSLYFGRKRSTSIGLNSLIPSTRKALLVMFLNNVYSHHLKEIFSVISCCRMFVINVYSHHLKETFSVIFCCRMFVNNVCSHHLKEIFSAVRKVLGVERDSGHSTLSSGLAPVGSQRWTHGGTPCEAGLPPLQTWFHHISVPPVPPGGQGPSLSGREHVGLDSVRGDILSYILGYPLRISHNEHEEQQTVAISVAHTILRFFTNFAKTGDPNSPGAEPDYENDKGGTNTWDMYEPVKQLYLAIGEVTEVQSNYRGHKMALWLNLIQQLLNSENDFLSYSEFKGDEDNLYAGVVRPKTFTRPPTPTPTVTTPQGQDCVWNTTSVERPLPPPLQDVFRLTGPWGVTFAIGCLLLLCNLLLFASVYRRHFRTKNSFELRYRAAADGSCPEERLIAKSQSAPELATTSFLSERTSPKVLKRSQNKSSV